LVVVAKKAVGAEYDYQIPDYKEKNKRVVSVRVSRSTSPLAIMVCGALLIAILFSVGLSYTFIKASKARLHLELSQLQQSNQGIFMENEKLKLEIAKLKSLDRIEKIASVQMGMIKNPEVEYLAVQLDNSSAGFVTEERTTTLQADKNMTEELTAGQKIIQGIVAVIKEKAPVKKG
jgi:cell division protein FtsL